MSHFYHMKNLKKIIAILFLLIGVTAISQENTQTEIAIINQNNIDYKLSTITPQNQTNSAIITQIGNQNYNHNTIIAIHSSISKRTF